MKTETRILSAMHTPGAVLLTACYEFRHRPIGLTRPLRAFEAARFAPDAIDIAVLGSYPSTQARDPLYNMYVMEI